MDVEKCWTCGGLLIGLSGAGSVKQPLAATLEGKVRSAFGDQTEIDRWEARELLRSATGDVLGREYSNFVPSRPGQTAANTVGSVLLVIGRDVRGYWLLEIDHNNQPSFYTEHGFHTVGSGAAAAYLAQGLLKAYDTGRRSIDHLKLVAYRTVDTCINVLGGQLGVGGFVQLYASREGGAFIREDDEGLAQLRDGLEKWTTLEAESLDRVVLGTQPSETERGVTLPEPIEDGDV